MPESKRQKGYRFEPDKFGASGLTPVAAGLVRAPLVGECPVQLEAVMMGIHPIADENPVQRGRILSLELTIVRVHLDEAILMDGCPNRVDPDKWRPLIMSFQQFYGLGQQVRASTLAQIPERLYRTADIEAAQK